jgi:hypothetical protein
MMLFIEVVVFWLCFAVGAVALLFGGCYTGIL